VGNNPVNYNDPDGLLAKSAGNWLDTQTHGYFSDFVDVGRDTLSLPGVQKTLYGGAAMAAGGGVGSSLLSNPVTRAVAGAAATVLDLQNAADGVPAGIVPAGIRSAEIAADIALAAGKTSGAAAELRVGNQVFTGVSGEVVPHNPQVTGALMGTPAAERKPWHGGCAEIVWVLWEFALLATD
jgi:hypothetical protein